uniref:Uncharacterized protein n=1 Tax=Macrostomum lignano TaxID=282301 RepID=A0A1I8FEJ7_9PLAT
MWAARAQRQARKQKARSKGKQTRRSQRPRKFPWKLSRRRSIEPDGVP